MDGTYLPLARFFASCSGVKLATPREPGMVFLLLGSGPLAEAGVDWREPSLWPDSPVLVSLAGRSRLATEARPEGRARDAAAVESLLDMA